MANDSRDALYISPAQQALLEPYLPQKPTDIDMSPGDASKPFVTLTYATSLDSMLAIKPGVQTALSGPESKAMTHFLRSRHDGILIGVGTAVADNPSLNCRFAGVGGYGAEGLVGQPRPVILDPHARWDFSQKSKLFSLIEQGRGRAPLILTANPSPPAEKTGVLSKVGGEFVEVKMINDGNGQLQLDWRDTLMLLRRRGLTSVMIEGGAGVINSLLTPEYSSLIDSVIVTIAPTWLGQGGVLVSPAGRQAEAGTDMAVARLSSVQWLPFGQDVVMCGKLPV